MSELKKEYARITEQRAVVINELKQLKNEESVKRYLKLKEQNDNLYYKQLNLTILLFPLIHKLNYKKQSYQAKTKVLKLNCIPF